jgi:aminoglycoside phosphotransferase
VPRVVAFDGDRLLLDELPGVPLADADDLPVATLADLAIAAREVAGDFGAAWVPRWLEAYGVPPDAAKLGFFRLLDELF